MEEHSTHPKRSPRGAVVVRDETDLGRLIGISDGVFAFALTLLVLSLTVPILAHESPNESAQQINGQLGAALQKDWFAFLAYAFAFLLIANWWVVHNRTFRYIQRYDERLVWLNFAVLMEVAVMPFVLGVFATYSDTAIAVALFSGVQGVTGLTLNLMWRYAISGDRLVHPDFDPKRAREVAFYGILPSLVFVAAVPVAIFVNVAYAEFLWLLLFPARRFSHLHGL